MLLDLIVLIIQYFKKKKAGVPSFVLIVVIAALFFGLILFFINQKEENKQENQTISNSGSFVEESKKDDQNKFDTREIFSLRVRSLSVAESSNVREGKKEEKADKKLEVNESENTPEQNSDSIQNFTPFFRGLVDRLKEKGFDESFGSNLAHRIRENLENEQGNERQLIKTIREELGPNASADEVNEVHRSVLDVINQIAEDPSIKNRPTLPPGAD